MRTDEPPEHLGEGGEAVTAALDDDDGEPSSEVLDESEDDVVDDSGVPLGSGE